MKYPSRATKPTRYVEKNVVVTRRIRVHLFVTIITDVHILDFVPPAQAPGSPA